MSNWSIGQELGRTTEAVRHKAAKCGLQYQTGRPFTAAEDVYIWENYATSRMKEMVTALGRHHNSIRNRARQLGLVNAAQAHNRAVRATVRHDYFSQVDSPMKAYMLGLMITDGYVSSGKSNNVNFKVSHKDRQLAELVRDELSPETRIREHTLAPLPGYSKVRHYVQFAVGSAQMKKDLMSLGVTPRKTRIIRYPRLAPHLAAAFICGCFDGDGCLTRKPHPRWDLYSASRLFLVEIQEVIAALTEIKLSGPQVKKGVFCIRLASKVHDLDAWLHADVPGLPRKRLSALGNILAFRQEERALRLRNSLFPAETGDPPGVPQFLAVPAPATFFRRLGDELLFRTGVDQACAGVILVLKRRQVLVRDVNVSARLGDIASAIGGAEAHATRWQVNSRHSRRPLLRPGEK
jgi:hypothetical protein